MSSRLTSHLNESSPTLFHSGLGSVDPVAVRLELTRGHTDDASHADTITMLAALLHERHHWLQHIGTSAGLFGSVLLELQSALIGTGVPLGALRAEDLPLLRQEDRFPGPLLAWERLEATRRFYFGCRPGDIETLTSEGRHPLWRELADMLEPVIGIGLTDLTGFREVRAALAKSQPPRSEALRDAGWSVGAKHLMEGAARQTEMFRLLDAAVTTTGEFALPAHFYTGVYGVARGLFDSIAPMRTAAAEIGFAFACDLALNCLSPPLFPFPAYNPGTYFGHVAHRLASFRFDRSVDVTDPAAVRALLAELTEHAGDDLVTPTRLKHRMITRFLGHLHPDEVAGQLFTLSGHNLPVPTGPSVRMRYELALATHAERLRAQAPELFVFPSAPYLSDRAAFRELFEQVQPPLVAYGDSGIVPTRRVPGWLEFFLATGVHYELLRAMVMCDVQQIAARLVPYVRSVFGHEHGMAVIRQVIDGVFQRGPVAAVIWQETTAAVARTGPVRPT